MLSELLPVKYIWVHLKKMDSGHQIRQTRWVRISDVA